MKYQITMSSGEKYWITDQEAVNIAKGELKGLVMVPSIKGYINLSFVQSVVPEDKIDKSKINYGRLHDGTRVVKKFGIWTDAERPEATLDPLFFPEIANDTVMTEEEYKTKKTIRDNLLKKPNKQITDCERCGGNPSRHREHTENGQTYSFSYGVYCDCIREEINREYDKLKNIDTKQLLT